MESGITMLDTSASYGTAENEIGEYIKTDKGRTLPIVVTKFKIGRQSLYKTQQVRDEIYKSLRLSLQRLNLQKIPVYLLHKDREQQLEQLIEPLSMVFAELKQDGLIDIAGISAFGPEDIDIVINHEILEAVQLPVNIFDQRLINNGKMDELKVKNKIVFARSIFLQGLFFMKSVELPEKLQDAKQYLERLGEIAQAAGLTVPQICFSFVNNIQAISSIIFGAINVEQVKQNVSLSSTPALGPEITKSIREAFADVPEHVITPGSW